MKSKAKSQFSELTTRSLMGLLTSPGSLVGNQVFYSFLRFGCKLKPPEDVFKVEIVLAHWAQGEDKLFSD